MDARLESDEVNNIYIKNEYNNIGKLDQMKKSDQENNSEDPEDMSWLQEEDDVDDDNEADSDDIDKESEDDDDDDNDNTDSEYNPDPETAEFPELLSKLSEIISKQTLYEQRLKSIESHSEDNADPKEILRLKAETATLINDNESLKKTIAEMESTHEKDKNTEKLDNLENVLTDQLKHLEKAADKDLAEQLKEKHVEDKDTSTTYDTTSSKTKTKTIPLSPSKIKDKNEDHQKESDTEVESKHEDKGPTDCKVFIANYLQEICDFPKAQYKSILESINKYYCSDKKTKGVPIQIKVNFTNGPIKYMIMKKSKTCLKDTPVILIDDKDVKHGVSEEDSSETEEKDDKKTDKSTKDDKHKKD